MNGASLRQHAEQVKWWDVLDQIALDRDFVQGRAMARECRHPDALWLLSLSPSDDHAAMTAALEACGEDPRALYLRDLTIDVGVFGTNDHALCRRAAERGYAPAQAARSAASQGAAALAWAELAADQGDRTGLFRLGDWFWNKAAEGERDRWRLAARDGRTPDLAECAGDRSRALALYKEGAELGARDAQYAYGRHGYRVTEWQGYRWIGRAAARGCHDARWWLAEQSRAHVRLPEGGWGRVVFEIGRALRLIAGEDGSVPFCATPGTDCARSVRQCVAWHRQWSDAARAGIDCWSIGALRMGVPYDIRLIVVTLVWEDRAVWSEEL
jgi:hypothetical protein